MVSQNHDPEFRLSTRTPTGLRRCLRPRTWLAMAGMFALTTLGLITAAGPAMAAAPAPIALTSTKCPSDITEGEINGCVTELQTLLNKNGASLTVDGDFGAATLAAVKSYQSSHGLEVDGIVGPMTKDELDGSTGGAPAPIAINSSACPANISEGEDDGCVTELQTLLNHNGAGLTVDGDFGPATLTAVENYQRAHGLSVDGVVGANTKAALLGSTAPAPISLTSSSCPADMSEGEIDGCVTELQTLLNKNGAGLTLDGDFGPLTLTAVENYQSSHGLAVDGIVGPNTKAALDGTQLLGAQADPAGLLVVPRRHLRGRDRRLRHRAAGTAEQPRCRADRGRRLRGRHPRRRGELPEHPQPVRGRHRRPADQGVAGRLRPAGPATGAAANAAARCRRSSPMPRTSRPATPSQAGAAARSGTSGAAVIMRPRARRPASARVTPPDGPATQAPPRTRAGSGWTAPGSRAGRTTWPTAGTCSAPATPTARSGK